MPRPKSTLGAIVELVVIVGFAIGLALLIQAFVVKPFAIPSGSMKPTLEDGQRILVQRVSYRFSDPEVGDIVVFKPPKDARCAPGANADPKAPCAEGLDEQDDENFVKRIVAGPGDEIAVKDGHPVVNGEEVLDESFIKECGEDATVSCDLPHPITIPDDHYFMMGDNRGQSDDSRVWGPLPRDWIIGKAFATYWPIDRIGVF